MSLENWFFVKINDFAYVFGEDEWFLMGYIKIISGECSLFMCWFRHWSICLIIHM